MKFQTLPSKFSSIMIFWLLIISCAKVEPPPGGPIDKTGPSIIATNPAADAIGVPKSNKIAVTFSEGVDHHSAEEAVFISPRFKESFEHHWKGKTLILSLPDSFADSTTYIVSMGAGITDLRSNKMGKSYLFAFSTGQEISPGKIAGFTYLNNKPASNIAIGIFDSAVQAIHPYLDSIYPAYMTLSGDKGEYSFEYLPFNRYLLIAFNDKDKDQLFDYPDEDFGIPDRMANVFEGRIPTLNFIMQREETASVSIISAGPTADHLVKARLSRPVKAERLIVNLDKITLSPTDSTMPALNPKSMMENEEDSVSTFDFYFGEIPDGTYRLKIDKSILMARVDSIPFIESAVLKIKSEPDKNPPFILSVSQNGKTVFPDEKIVRFSFSEPIDRKKAGDSLATLAIKDGDTIRTNLKWLDDFKVDLIPDSLKWGKTYIITIHQNSLVDLSGNKAGDSTRIFSFKTFDKDSLGGISGTISYSGDVDSSGLSYLNFMLLGEGKKIVAPVPGKIFNLQLPPGKYLLSGFIDLNGNGKQDQGRLKPLEFSETVSAFPDTVRVRSRFETSGVDFIFK